MNIRSRVRTCTFRGCDQRLTSSGELQLQFARVESRRATEKERLPQRGLSSSCLAFQALQDIRTARQRLNCLASSSPRDQRRSTDPLIRLNLVQDETGDVVA